METEDKQLTQEESLQIIHNMIAAAKNDVKADSFVFLLWGYLVFIASTLQLILYKMEVPHNDLVWLLMPVGAVITIINSVRRNKREKTKTYVSEFLKYTWIAFAVGMGILMFFSSMGPAMLPGIMTMYGIGLFISGGALRFTPLVIGGIFCWICSIAAYEIHNEYQLLVLAAAVLGGYIIPGHLLKINNREPNV